MPEETLRVARAASPGGSPAIRIRDALGVISEGEQLEGLFSLRGQPALSPGRLAMVSVLQFSEGLPDRQAAEAVRARIDRKYALGLELSDPGFDFSVLSEFRARLVAGSCEQQILDTAATRPGRASMAPSPRVSKASAATVTLPGNGEDSCSAPVDCRDQPGAA